MSTLNFPPSLTEIQSLNDHEHVSCVGRSCPTVGTCPHYLDPKDEIFCVALQKLQNLSESGLSFVHGLDTGLIGTLEDIALGFSCKSHRRGKQRRALPYYWIALLVFPKFLKCMGFKGLTTEVCSMDMKQWTQSAIDGLKPDELWILNKARSQLDWAKESQRDKRNDAVALFFINLITRRLESDKSETQKHQKQDEAEERWRRWHDMNAEQRERWDPNLQRSFRNNFSIHEPSILLSRARDPSFDYNHGLSQSNPNTPFKGSVAPQIPARPGSAPHKMPTSVFPPPSTPTPTKSCRRSSKTHSPLQDKSVRKRNASSQFRASRRTSATSSALQQAQELQTQHPHSQNYKDRLTEGYFQTHPGNRDEGNISSSSDAVIDAIEDPHHPVSSTIDQENGRERQTSGLSKAAKVPSIIDAVFEVFDLMQKDLDVVNDDQGRVYALGSVEHPGLIKIGRSERNVEIRKKSAEGCVGDTEHISYDHYFPVSNYKRVEKLIHKELEPYKLPFECTRGKCGQLHGEWFKIDVEKALKTIKRWKKWMNQNPYDNRKLLTIENLRINKHKNEKRVEQLICKDDKGNSLNEWDWDAFMRYSLFYLRIEHYLFRQRPEKSSTRSVWMSLRQNLQPNLIFYTAVFLFSTLMFSIADYAIPLLASAQGLGFVNAVVLGSLGVFYAA